MKRKVDIGQLVARYRSGGAQADRDRIALAAEPLVRSIIARMRIPDSPLVSKEDLMNVGIMAGLQALDSYEESKGASFMTFAYSRIRGEVIDFLRRIDPLPRRRRAKVAARRKAHERLEQEMGCTPDDRTVAERMGLSLVDYHTVLRDDHRRRETSLAQPLGKEPGLTLLDIIVDENGEDDFETPDAGFVRGYLEDIVRSLPERERVVLSLSYEHDMKLSQIGEILDVSEARASQLRKKALAFLREVIDEEMRWAA